jgi:hypothetical protein
MHNNKTKKVEIKSRHTFANACLTSYQKFIAQIERVKGSILVEFREKFDANKQLFDLAINEAETLAWKTGYPQLVFPTLAMERVQAVAGWDTGQKVIHQNNSV